MNTLLRSISLQILDMARVPDIFLFLKRNQPIIFLYHGVAPAQPEYGIFNYRGKFIEPELFQLQLEWLKNRFTILPLSTLIHAMQSGAQLPPYSCAITFDDGYENVYRHAFPLLKKNKIPATVFVTTNLLDQKEPLWVDILEYAIGNTEKKSLTINSISYPTDTFINRCKTDAQLRDHLKKISRDYAMRILQEIVAQSGKDLTPIFHNSPYRGMTWDQAREMQNAGITIAPHTASHPILSHISTEEEREEIRHSQQRIQEELNTTTPIFAYPNGQPKDFTDQTITILRELNITSALTTTTGTLAHVHDFFRIPRITLDRTDNMGIFRITASGLRHALIRLLGRS